MKNPPKIPLGGAIANPYTKYTDSGNYLLLTCGTCEEQFGSVLSDESKDIPLRRWITIEQLGMGNRLRKAFEDETYQGTDEASNHSNLRRSLRRR